MFDERPVAVSLYRKLIRLYPRAFRERLAVSMERTFIDLYDEHRGSASCSFLVTTFVNTFVSIVDQHYLEAERKLAMRKNIVVGLIAGFAPLLPLAMMEYVNTQGARFPVVLYSMLWALGFIFVLLLTPTLRELRAGGAGVLANPAGLLLRTALMITIAVIWVGVVVDQTPCLIGVPNCD